MAPTKVEPRRAGSVAAAAGLAAAELLGSLLPHRPSLVLGIADRVIAITPATVREALIGVVGTQDKLLLAIGIVVAVVSLGAGVGARSARGRLASVWALGLIAFACALGSAPVWEITALAAGAAAVSYVALGRLAPAPVPVRQPEPISEGLGPISRRTFFSVTGLATFAVLAGSGAVIIRRGAVTAVNQVRATLKLASSTRPVTIDAAADPHIAGLAPAITPNRSFYRIDTALEPPTVDINNWSLRIEGLVDHPLTFTYEQLSALPQVSAVVTLACVSNTVGGDLVSNAIWQGVPLRALLDQAGVQAGADQLVGESVDGFTAGFPVALALDGREALVAVGMNGEVLPIAHGFPARLVVPGLYGYVSATKWLRRIRLTTMAAESPFWIQQGWSPDGRVTAAARIDVPRAGVALKSGPTVVAGRAWHQHTGVGGVEVQIDTGPWQPATLAAGMGTDAWRLWTLSWNATPGQHRLTVRMIDPGGAVQSGNTFGVFPGPSSGWHQIHLNVS
ncbi:MAG: molybdopterin-dependent oxidoreductase [Actinomycetes bacterium]